MRKWLLAITAAAAQCFSASAAAVSSPPMDKSCPFHHQEHPREVREQTQSAEILPHFLDTVAPHIREIYRMAAKNSALLKYIACYCGCGEKDHHIDTLSCFIFKEKPDGSIIWDKHAAECGICLDTAKTAVINYQSGKSIKEVRRIIDERYQKGFKKPTPTPLPD
ncbi:PCYCGC motif-containing (lipo)protein [Peribacillus kribbensis]|uniref:PCYCGC motif-containing (lipo)protein n=1 Tax=Peribacillus kribbensis TaxID=356658 RepID=UPI0004193788|nr:PCYCGC motif-containing (lipo)protein [Peribacillus kribbensis]